MSNRLVVSPLRYLGIALVAFASLVAQPAFASPAKPATASPPDPRLSRQSEARRNLPDRSGTK
jgi:hypothetical protein